MTSRNRTGIMIAESSPDETLKICQDNNIEIVRSPIFLSLRTQSSTIDFYLDSGLKVCPNINWSAIKGSVSLLYYKERLQSAIEHLAPDIDNIPFLTCENEWDNSTWTAEQYSERLNVFVEVAHASGFKVAEGGITSTGLRRWTYSKLFAEKQVWWRDNYFVGLNLDYTNFVLRINQFLSAFVDIPFNKSNVHWYNLDTSFGGFPTASSLYMSASGKRHIVCNEAGIFTPSLDLFKKTKQEISEAVQYTIFYSGVDSNAITLTPEMLKLLN